jgi:hypothetical protein
MGPVYTFKPGQRRLVRVKVSFAHEQAGAVNLVDVEDARRCWGLRRTTPAGKRETVQAARVSPPDVAGVTIHRLTHGKSFGRSLDLGALADFSASGLYHVQLIYQSPIIADEMKGDWVGMFSGPVFVVKVLP